MRGIFICVSVTGELCFNFVLKVLNLPVAIKGIFGSFELFRQHRMDALRLTAHQESSTAL